MIQETKDYMEEMAAPSHCSSAEIMKAHRAYVKVLGTFGVQVAAWVGLLDDLLMAEERLELKSRAFELRQKTSAAIRQLTDIQTLASKLFRNLQRIEEVHADFCEKEMEDHDD